MPLFTNSGLYSTYRTGLPGYRWANPAPSRSFARAPCMVMFSSEYPLVSCGSSQWIRPARMPPTRYCR